MHYRTFIKNRNFTLLWASQTISQFGDRLNQMALIGVVYEKMSASPLALAKILFFAILPVFLLSPIAGVYVDRWDLRKTMIFSDLMRGILVLGLPLLLFRHASMAGIYALIFVIFCIGRFFVPAKLAIIPRLVKSEQIFMANSLISTTGMVAAVLGFGIGGVIVEHWGARGAFIIDAATFFISALLITFLRKTKPHVVFNPRDLIDLGKSIFSSIKKSFLRELTEGVRYIATSVQTRFVFRSLSILFSCLGSLYVVFIIFIQETLGSKTQDLGFLVVFLGVGLFAGSLVYGKIGLKLSVSKTINASLLISGVYLVVFVIAVRALPHKPFAMLSTFFLGLLIAPIVIGGSSLIHQNSNKNLWGRIFSSLEVVIHFFFLLFMFIASFLAEKMNSFTIIIAVGAVIIAVSSFNLFRDRHMGGTLLP